MTSGPEPDPGPRSEYDDGHPGGVPVPRPGPASDSSAEPTPATDAALDRVLRRSRELGFLGPGPIDAHIHHAAAFLPGIDELESRQSPSPVGDLTLVDLGSGGGLPGLVLAVRRPRIHVVLIDAIRKRTDFLEWAVAELGVDERVEVRRGRAEELAREPDLRGSAEVVTARSFGPPAVAAGGGRWASRRGAGGGAQWGRVGGRAPRALSAPPRRDSRVCRRLPERPGCEASGERTADGFG